MKPHPVSTSTRLALLVSAAFLAGFVLLALVQYLQVSKRLERDTREFVQADANELLDVYRDTGRSALLSEVARRAKDPSTDDLVYAVIDQHGARIAGDAAFRVNCVSHHPSWVWQQLGDGEGRRVLARITPLQSGQCLVNGLRTRAADGFLAVMLRAAAYAALLAIALGALVGWMVRQWVAHRLHHIDHVATRVATGELGLRVGLDGSGDAFDLIAGRINTMLDRIGELLDGVRHVTDHIAHDLRTPLTRLRNRLEALRASPSLTLQDRAALEVASGEVDGLLQTFSSLLRLSRLEQAPEDAQVRTVELQALTRDALELYAPLAAERGMRLIDATQPVCVSGEADQLFQMAVNLIDNAVKYAPADSAIEVVTARAADGMAVFEIADHGEGIASIDRERVFDRFERLEAHRGSPGHGLGLSIVRAIVHRHHGTIELLDNLPGLRVRVCMPAVAD